MEKKYLLGAKAALTGKHKGVPYKHILLVALFDLFYNESKFSKMKEETFYESFDNGEVMTLDTETLWKKWVDIFCVIIESNISSIDLGSGKKSFYDQYKNLKKNNPSLSKVQLRNLAYKFERSSFQNNALVRLPSSSLGRGHEEYALKYFWMEEKKICATNHQTAIYECIEYIKQNKDYENFKKSGTYVPNTYKNIFQDEVLGIGNFYGGYNLGSKNGKIIFTLDQFESLAEHKYELLMDSLNHLALFFDKKDVDSEIVNKLIRSIPLSVDHTTILGNELEISMHQAPKNRDAREQREFRNKMIVRYKSCYLCNLENLSLLDASHLYPQSKLYDMDEKFDEYNGMLLCKNHHYAYDNGLISFDKQGNVLISSEISSNDSIKLLIKEHVKLEKRHLNYTLRHRDNIFRK